MTLPLQDTVLASTASLQTILANGSRTGFVYSASDQDWFRISLVAGLTYTFDLDGGTLDGTLALRNSLGTQLQFNDDSGPGFDSRIEFTATTSGTYFLDVGGFVSSAGSYTLRATIDDASADTSTLDNISVNGSRTGIVNSAADQDWYRINLVAGQTYTFDADGGLLDATLALRNSLGTQLAVNDDAGPGLDSRIEFTATTSGTYFLDVGGFGTSTGAYTLRAALDDASADTSTLDNIAVNSFRTGIVNSATDQDWFRVNLVAGQTYTFDADGGTLDATLALRNSAGTQLAFNDDGGPGVDSRIEFTATATGSYFLDVGGFGTSTGGYTLRANLDDAASDTDTLDSIALNSFRTGIVNSATDQDWFRVNLVAGQTYTFDADGGTLDATLALRNSAGTQLAFNDDGGPGLDSRIEFTATATGSYFLDVGGFGTSTGGYTLRTAIDDAASDTDTLDSIAPFGVRSGVVNSGTDQDWFRINLVAGQFYTFDAVGGGVLDPTLTLRNSAGTQLRFDDDSGAGLNSFIGFTAPTTGTYYLDVGGFGSSTGSYTLFG